MTNTPIQPEPYAGAVRKLLKGVVYHDDDAKVWSQIRTYELPLREYLAKIGLALYLDEGMGFAYLHEGTLDEDGKTQLPALTIQRQLSFALTLLLVLLRERLEEHLIRNVEQVNLYLSQEDILEMLLMFMGDSPDARRTETQLMATINRAVDYGFLKRLSDERYLVRPVLRAKIHIDTLQDIKEKLQTFIQQGAPDDDDAHV